MTSNWRSHIVVAAAGTALFLSGCSSLAESLIGPGDDDGDQAGEEVIEADDAIDDGAADDPADDDAQAEPAGEGLDPLPVTPQQVDATVHYDGMELTIEAMDVIDWDAEEGRETRMHGAQLVFNGSVTNPSSSNPSPAGAPVGLRWEDPATGHSFEVFGSADTGGVPSGASGPLEFDLDLSVEQLETFETSTAVLSIGYIGHGQAHVPLGDGELITRIPVPQADLVGESFDIEGPVTVTIEEADLRWDIGGESDDDDTAVLEIIVRLENNSDGQRCWARGTGSNFSLVKADGTGTADLSMSDRGCAPSGDSSVSVTGIPVHQDYAGDYTLTHRYGDVEDSIDFTMVDGPGVLLSER